MQIENKTTRKKDAPSPMETSLNAKSSTKNNNSTKDKSQSGRTRNYATMVYPESAPEGWQEILAEQCVPAFISPLHAEDLLPTGEPKKPHYHVMVMYDGVKTTEQAKELFTLIGGVGVEKVGSVRGYARYLCHLDSPDKAQYDVSDVRSIAGADYISTIGLASDKYVAIGEMIDWCEQENIFSYAELLTYCRNNRNDWFRVLCDNGTMVMIEYLKSRKWTIDQHLK